MTSPALILVVDDDLDILEALAELLEGEGYETRRAHNGAEALAQLARGLRPDLVILDLMMPVMNGWEFLDHLRAQPEVAHLPVVVLSASRERVDPHRVVEQLPKPFTIGALLGHVRGALGA